MENKEENYWFVDKTSCYNLFSNRNVHAQCIDDEKGHTLASISTNNSNFKTLLPNVKGAQEIGDGFADVLSKENISTIVFDRAGRKYHGCVKAFAEALRSKKHKILDMKNNSKKSGPESVESTEPELFEKVVHINRCAKVVKGGRRFSFAALVVVGDQSGNVGYGYGKAQMVPDAMRKGTDQAKKAMRHVSISGDTLPHPVLGVHDGGKVMLRPAREGTGIIAGEVEFVQCLKPQE